MYVLRQPYNYIVLIIFIMLEKYPTRGDWASKVKELTDICIIQLNIPELDGVGPVDNRPSTD